MLNLASPGHGVKFRCRSAAKHRKVHQISAVSQGRQKSDQHADHNQISGAEGAIFPHKNAFFRCRQRKRPGLGTAANRGDAQRQARVVVELETEARRQTRRPGTLAAWV